MKKLHIILIISLLLLTPTLIYASNEVISREAQQVDEAISEKNTTKYADPQKILVVQIKSDAEIITDDPQQWFNTLYYYSITRLGYADIPFNYVIDRNGEIYEGRSGGDGVVPELYNDQGAIVIGYLSSSLDITPSADQSLGGLVQELSYRYGIDKSNFEVVQLQRMLSDQTESLSKNQYEQVNNNFTIEVYNSIEDITFSKEEHLPYKVEIIEIIFDETVKAGEQLKVQVKMKNVNDFSWFADTDYIYLSVLNDKESLFAVNGVWESFSKPLHIENAIVLPDEMITLEFSLQAKMLPGSHTETFELLKIPDSKFEGSSFTVSFEITKGDFDLIKINSEEAGFLNVRDCPSTGCAQVGTVEHDSIYISKGIDGAWYKIEYDDGKDGWVYAKFVEKL